MPKSPLKPPLPPPTTTEIPELTLEEWHKTPELPALLEKTMKEPHMKIFMGILCEYCRFSNASGPTLIAGVDPIQGGAILNSFREGGNSIITLIKRMMRNRLPKQEQGTPDPRFWGEVKSFNEPPKQ